MMKHLWFTSALLTLTACGPQAFVPSSASSTQTPAGAMNVPPKVDIVLGVSNNGTMRNIIKGVETQIPAFLKTLQDSGWDYRFVSIPLSEYRPTDNISVQSMVAVSKYDANYPLGTWMPPYPGADHSTASRVLPSLFTQYPTVYPFDSTIPNDNHESGFHNELTFLSRSDIKSDFLRPDAMLAVITLSNADDRSDWTWGAPNTTDQGYSNVPLNNQASFFRNIKGANASITKYYSLVAAPVTSCRGYNSWSGSRYRQMTGLLGGASSDICTSDLSASLNTVKTDLASVKLNFRKHYLLIGNLPNIPTIVVTKYIGGDANSAQTVPQDATNGWTYVGAITAPTYLIDAPVPMNLVNPGDGYLIELHGSAKLDGGDTANVTYQNAGTVSSH